MAKMSIKNSKTEAVSAPGRSPPPVETRFQKGQSGNPRGRPKGAVSISALTETFALKRLPITINGKQQKLSRIEIAIIKLTAIAADGKPAAAEQLTKLRDRSASRETDDQVPILLVPATLTLAECTARMEEDNKHAVEPGTAINLEAEEFIKAARGESTALGEALLAHHRKYRG